MRPGLSARLARAAAKREAAGLVRARSPADAASGMDFCGNDYLGLARHPALAEALAEGARRHGTGAGASPLISGYQSVHRALEEELADFLGFESVCLFPAGYQANLAVGQVLLDRGRGVLADRLNHASMNDGARLAGARFQRYRHGDAADAEARIDDRTRVVASDGVFSMDGDLAPVTALADLADARNLALWLDDAHGIGVLGAGGRGLMEHAGLDPARVDAFTGTFGKALGTGGAFVAGDAVLIAELESAARGLVYSTGLSPALAAATRRALEILRADDGPRARLRSNIAHYRQRAGELGMASTETTIQPVVIGDNDAALAAARLLAERGFRVGAIRPPTVPAGSARLRISLSAAHEPEAIDRLLEAVAEIRAGVPA